MDRNASNPTPIRENTKVALRKESVDRNENTGTDWIAMTRSLSARRAWIEMLIEKIAPALVTVALRKESVDRNECDWKLVDGVPCRSPQGERGMFLFLTVQGGFVHADIRFNFKNCYSKKLSHKII